MACKKVVGFDLPIDHTRFYGRFFYEDISQIAYHFGTSQKKRNVYVSNSGTNLSLSHIQSIYSGSSVCNSPRVIEILCVHVHRTRIVNDNRFRSLSLLILRKIQLCSTNPIVFSTRTQANKSSHIHKTTFAWMKNEQKKMRSTCELDLLLVKIYLSGTMLIESK